MDKEKIKVGTRVHGILASIHPISKRSVNSRYDGEVVKVEESCFRVKYRGIRVNLPYRYENLGRTVFLDEYSCENKIAEVESPKIQLGGNHE